MKPRSSLYEFLIDLDKQRTQFFGDPDNDVSNILGNGTEPALNSCCRLLLVVGRVLQHEAGVCFGFVQRNSGPVLDRLPIRFQWVEPPLFVVFASLPRTNRKRRLGNPHVGRWEKRLHITVQNACDPQEKLLRRVALALGNPLDVLAFTAHERQFFPIRRLSTLADVLDKIPFHDRHPVLQVRSIHRLANRGIIPDPPEPHQSKLFAEFHDGASRGECLFRASGVILRDASSTASARRAQKRCAH